MSLIEQVRRKLNITWSDEDTDKRVADISDSAAIALRHKLGISDPTYDFSQPGQENMLFLSLCLYEWNHATHEFDVNYANDIAQVRALYEAKQYQEKEAAANGADQ